MAGHEKVYVVCENKCFEEGMTKAQILDLTSKASNGIVDPLTGKTYKVRVLSKAEYDSLPTVSDDTIYYVYDEDLVTDIALYASEDKSKGTIEQRLNALGFKEGTFSVSGVSASGSVTNSLKKQGKYVIANLQMVASGNFNNAVIGLPIMFRPKQDTTIGVGVVVNGYTTFIQCTVTTTGFVNGIGTNVSAVMMINAGWEV